MSGYARLVNIVFWLGLVAWVSAVAAAGVAASATFTILPDLGLTVSGYQLTDTVQHGRLAAGKVMEPVFAFVDVVQLLAAMLVVVACLVQNTLIKVPWRTPANVIRVLGIILAAGLLLGRMALLSPDMNRQLRAYWSAAASGDTAAGEAHRAAFDTKHGPASTLFTGTLVLLLVVVAASAALSSPGAGRPLTTRTGGES